MDLFPVLASLILLSAAFTALLIALVRAVRDDGSGHLPPIITQGGADMPQGAADRDRPGQRNPWA